MTNPAGRPLPSPAELHRFATRVRDEMTRAWMAGEPDAIPPVQLRPVEALEAERHLLELEVAEQEAAWLRRDDERRRAELAADPARQEALRELVGDAGLAASLGAAAPSLVTEGIPQRSDSVPLGRFSQQTSTNRPIRRSSARALGALALADPERPPTPRELVHELCRAHDGHRCCQDVTSPRGSRALVGRQPERELDGELAALVLPLRCKSWRCDCCKHRLRARNRKRAIRGAQVAGQTLFFATFTIDPTHPRYRAWLAGQWPAKSARACRHSGRPVRDDHRRVIEAGGRLLSGRQARARESIPYLSDSWNRLRLAMDRRFGGRLEYYRAIELHQSGTAHMHVLMRSGTAGHWFMHFSKQLRPMLRRAGFGGVTDVQEVRSRGDVARYVTKMTAGYVSKDAEAMPRWSRRGTWSRGWSDWTPATPIAGFQWELTKAAATFVAAGLEADGYRLLDPGAFRIRPAPS